MFRTQSTIRSSSLSTASTLAIVAACFAVISTQPANALIVRDDVGLDNSVDTDDIYPAVVQIFDWDVGNLYGGGSGSIYYNCTGTLINPRTILTAAHCVTNDGATSSEDWGYPGDAPLSKIISFGVDTRTRLMNFINAPTMLGYNEGGVAFSTDVIIHPSAEPTLGNQAFPWTDTALIALSEPVADIGSMGILLSPLSELTHVVQIGYGTYGTGEIGQLGIGTRRLVGENMLGILGSNSDFIDAIFPDYAPSALTLGMETQVQYYTDFDNPDRPSANAGCTFTGDDILCTDADAVRNIDFFEGDALPREATTSKGDSGGPLIADQIYSIPLVIGDLSGGWTFFGTPSDQYGGNGSSFYQPLFSVWQFIVENNPYKYVGAKAGDGAWEDPDHWVQLLDPNMYIIDEEGNIVNGIPTGTECGVYQTGPKMGTVLGTDISSFSTDDSPYYFPASSGTCGPASGSGGGSSASVPGITLTSAAMHNDVSHAQVTGISKQADTVSTTAPTAIMQAATGADPENYGDNLPVASVLLGPGSTGFVPNNTDGTVGATFTTPATYFDVTLSENGTTTLSSFVEIDRLTMMGNAGLDIRSSGLLLSNIDVEMYGNSNLNVDGILGTSDVVIDSGVLTGNGEIYLGVGWVPSVLNAVVVGDGAISPGTVGSVGTLTVYGNVALSSGSLFLADADATTTDLLNVSGVLAVDGQVVFNSVAGVTPFYHQGGVIATASSIVTSGMSVPDSVTGVLYPVVALSHGSTMDVLSIQLEAAPFSSVFTPTTPDQSALANFFDGARGSSYDTLQQLYGPLDILEGSDLGEAFNQLIPSMQRAAEGGSTLVQSVFSSVIGGRLSTLHFAQRGEPSKTATGFSIDKPDNISLSMGMQSASDWAFLDMPFASMFSRSAAPSAASQGMAPASVKTASSLGGALSGWGGFLSGSIINGHTDVGTGKDSVNGYMLTAGLDTMVTDTMVLGGALSFSDTTVKGSAVANRSKIEAFQGSLYGTWSDPELNLFIDAYGALGALNIGMSRTATLGGTTYTAEGSPTGMMSQISVTIGTVFEACESISLYPMAGLEYDTVRIDAYDETGGIIAMHYDDDTTSSLLGRAGFEAKGAFQIDKDTTMRPRLRVAYVGDLEGSSGTFNAAYLAVPGTSIPFAHITHDRSWFELGGGIDIQISEMAVLQFGYDGAIDRTNAEYDTFTGRLHIKF